MKWLTYLSICVTILLSVGCSDNSIIADEPRQSDIPIVPEKGDTERDNEQYPIPDEDPVPNEGSENDPEEEWPPSLQATT